MYGNYKVVCVTAAGRRRYLQYLIPLVLSSDLVDRYDLWINTNDQCDVEFMRQMCDHYDRLNFVRQPENYCNGIWTLLSFWRYVQEEDTIYIRFDDDIVWLEPDFFEKLLKFRVEHRDYLFISPLIINNAKSTYLMQVRGALKLDKYTRSDVCGQLFWVDGCFATELHEWFISKYLNGDRSKLYVGEQPIALCRFSINCMAWFGEDLKPMLLDHKLQEEEYITEILPVMLNKGNCFYGDTIAVHYAFWKQRYMVDKTDLLDKYASSLRKRWESDDAGREVYEYAVSVMQNVASREKELRRQKTVYPSEFNKTGLSLILFRAKYWLWTTFWEWMGKIAIVRNSKKYKKHIME